MANILTVEQAAEKLQMTTKVIREYLRLGKLPGRKVGKAWRVLDTDLERWVSNGQNERIQHISDRLLPKEFKDSISSEALQTEKQHNIEKVERFSALGLCEGIPGFSTEEFLKNKREEVELEETKFQRTKGAA